MCCGLRPYQRRVSDRGDDGYRFCVMGDLNRNKGKDINDEFGGSS